MLTETQAVERAALVEAGVEYELYLHLPAGDDYHGVARCRFRMRQSQTTFIDFTGGSATEVSVNGRTLSQEEISEAHQEGKVQLRDSWLREGENEVVIAFKNAYSHCGEGLHAFADADGTFYAYCQTEPYYCCHIFPVFDQPDLKGHITYHLHHPRELTAVANTAVRAQLPGNAFAPRDDFERLFRSRFSADFLSGDWTLSSFARTARLPSYLFAFVLGHFAEAASAADEALPMRLFCRASLLERARAQSANIFAFARRGVAFFAEFFRTPFPFDKLDLVFGPEYTYGAMEYPGMVTFNDRYIYREVPTVLQSTRRGLVVLHELAHMWFGNYVTMRWWSDLWLNESFAELACFIALDAVAPQLGFRVLDAWSTFAAEKDWGYSEDQLETTHPIAGEVPNTSSAESIFDGITYSKGAAVLKQLLKRVGREAFSRGLQSYFARFCWKNATLSDLLEELSAAAPALDAAEWNATWISTAGLNAVEARWRPGADSLMLMQSAALSAHPTLRHHSLLGAFFGADGKVKQVLPFELSAQPNSLVTALVPDCAAFLPNHGDWGYVKVLLDPESAAFFRRRLAAVEGPDQLVVLQALCESVRDAQMNPLIFAEALLGDFLESAGPITLHAALLALVEAIDLVPAALAAPHADRAFLRVLDRLLAETDYDLRKELKFCALRLARSARCAELLANVVPRAAAHGLALTAEEEWSILLKATGWGVAPALLVEVRAAAEAKAEGDYARYFTLSLDALSCDAGRRAELEASLFDPACKFSHVEMEYVVRGLTHRALPEEKLTPLLDRLHEEFPRVANVAARSVWRTLLGIIDSHRKPADSLRRLRLLLPRIASEKKGVSFALRKMISTIERAMQVHDRFFTTSPLN